MMGGPNLEQMAAVCDAASCNVIASGGVSAVQNIVDLKSLDRANLSGAIVGKAFYEKTVTVAEMKAAAGE